MAFNLPSTYGLTAELEWGTATSGGDFSERIGIAAGLSSGPYIITGLEPNRDYAIQLRYRIQSGPLSIVRKRVKKTLRKPTIPKPTGVTISAVSDTSIRVAFDPSSTYRTRIRWGLNMANFVSISETVLPKNAYGTYDIEGLDASTTYAVRIAYIDDDDVAGEYFGQD